MRILVIADSHGDAFSVRCALEAQETATTVIHLGDGAREMEDVLAQFPAHTLYQVRGNGDFASGAFPLTQEVCLGGKRFWFTHGHLYSVKQTYTLVEEAARGHGADILLFGHTHVPYSAFEDGLYVCNPGSILGGGSYGIVDITPAGVVCGHRRVRP